MGSFHTHKVFSTSGTYSRVPGIYADFWHQKFRRKKPSAGSKYEWQYKIVSPAFCYLELWSKMYLWWAQIFSWPDAQKFGIMLGSWPKGVTTSQRLMQASATEANKASSPHLLLPQLEPDTRLWQRPSWRKGNLQLWPPKRRQDLVHSGHFGVRRRAKRRTEFYGRGMMDTE